VVVALEELDSSDYFRSSSFGEDSGDAAGVSNMIGGSPSHSVASERAVVAQAQAAARVLAAPSPLYARDPDLGCLVLARLRFCGAGEYVRPGATMLMRDRGTGRLAAAGVVRRAVAVGS
jgi:hypothetical protein